MNSSSVPPSFARLTLFRKIYSGSLTRKSRLHDELGAMVPLARLLRNGPRALLSGTARVLTGHRPERPWISYDAQRDLARALTPQSKVLEFGSGMSTMWYSRHAGSVISIEDYQPWFDLVSSRIVNLGNVAYHFAAKRADYVALAPDQQFDLIMIDGSHRDDCARFAVEHLAQDGIIYLDNSDKDIDEITGDIPEARRLLLAFAARKGLSACEFTDFAPTQLHAQRGLWIGPR